MSDMAVGEAVARLARELSHGVGDLPVLPRAAREALRLAQSSSVEPEEVSRLAESDPALAARMLAVANSALYARGTPVTSVQRAIVRLGMQATRDVLYQAVYATMLPDVPGFRERMADIFSHGVLVSRIARKLAPEQGLDADVAFIAGLLHDVGRARCLKIVARWAREGRAVDRESEVERAIDVLHASAGAELASAWRLPSEVVEACEFHHAPSGRPLPCLVALADALAHVALGKAAPEDEGVAAALDASHFDALRASELVALAAEEARFVKD